MEKGYREKYFDEWDEAEVWYNHLNTQAKVLVRRKKGPHGIYLREGHSDIMNKIK